jgi:hypothetical protein
VAECLEERSLAFAHRRMMTSLGFRVAKIRMRAKHRSFYMAPLCTLFVEVASGPAGASAGSV